MKLLGDLVYLLTIKPRLVRLQKLLPDADIRPSGSRFICSPPTMTTDIDFLVYAADDAAVGKTLLANGYKEATLEYANNADNSFQAYRKSWSGGKRGLNLVVTKDVLFSNAHIVATHLCRAWKVNYKLHRVAIFEVLRGNHDGYIDDLKPDLKKLVETFKSPHRPTLLKLYLAQHGVLGVK